MLHEVFFSPSGLINLVLILVLIPSISAAMECSDSSEVLAQKINPFPSSNGCSKPSGLSVGGEEDFTFCCDRHDACYSTCGISKSFCEKQFGKCMKNLCRTNFPQNRDCQGAADLYEMGTTMFGGSGFMDLQNDYCTCVKRADVVGHYKKIYQKIYNDHSGKTPEDIRTTINNLLVKAGENPSVRKLGAIFFRILNKYDTAIRHEDKRVGMNPPRPKDKDEL